MERTMLNANNVSSLRVHTSTYRHSIWYEVAIFEKLEDWVNMFLRYKIFF